MTLKQAIAIPILSFMGVCAAIPFFASQIERIQETRVPRRYTSQIDGEIYTLFLNNYATTLTVFTEHGKELIMDIERVRCDKTSIIFQRMELKK